MPLDPRRTLVLVLALLGMGVSAPAIRLAAAPALAVVLWRLLFALPPLCLMAWARRESWPLRPAAAAGIFLAAHWLLWVLAVQRTTIASATVLVSTGVLWTSLLSRPLLGEAVARRQWLGLALALLGVLAMVLWPGRGVGTAETSARGHDLLGDLLALGGAFAWVGYTFVGRRAREHAPFWAYTGAVYLTTAVVTGLASAIMLALTKTPTAAYASFSAQTWLALVVLAALPTLLGHGGLNYLLRFMGPARLSLFTLVEPLIAALLAWILFGEIPAGSTAASGAAILAGIALALSSEPSKPAKRRLD